MARVTVRSGRNLVAQQEIDVSDPRSAPVVEIAARAVCQASRKSFPSPATVVVEVWSGRWRKVAERVIP